MNFGEIWRQVYRLISDCDVIIKRVTSGNFKELKTSSRTSRSGEDFNLCRRSIEAFINSFS